MERNCRTDALSDRERQVLELLAAGHPLKQVAALLGVNRHTAREYERRALRKLGVRTPAAAAARIAVRQAVHRRPNISAREAAVALLVSEGLTNAEIARALRLSVFAVRDIVSRLLHKTGCSTRVALAAWAAGTLEDAYPLAGTRAGTGRRMLHRRNRSTMRSLPSRRCCSSRMRRKSSRWRPPSWLWWQRMASTFTCQ